MSKQKTANLFHIPFESLFKVIKTEYPTSEYDYIRHLILIHDQSKKELASLRLPLHLSINSDFEIISINTEVLYLSIESGSAGVILRKGKSTVFHKTISAYMSRKKQGFSQIKYLNKKGKSRAGSRVRLAATTEFFENINALTTDLLASNEVSRIALNCNKTLLPYLFQSKVPPPFEKKDNRLYKIPLHIPKSNTTQLEAAIKKLMAPILSFDRAYEDKFINLIKLDQ